MRLITKWFLAVSLVFVLTTVLAVLPAGAWFSRGHKTATGEEIMTERQTKALARKLMQRILDKPFFQEDELSRRVQMASLVMNVSHREMTDRQFTDLVLNATQDRPEILIVNQDPSLSISKLDIKLYSYDDEWASRKRGVMLGADFLLSGGVAERVMTDEKGAAYKVYEGTLSVTDIRSGKVMVEERVQQSRKKVKRKH